MRVLAIDPGYDRLGVAIMEKKDNKEVLIFSDCILTHGSDDLPERLPDTLGIETLFFNKNIKTAIGVAQARGIIMYLAKKANCALYEFGPQEIKIAVTGYGNSDKKSVIDMVKRLVPAVKDKAHDDEYDAVAVGITCLAHYRGS
jgi:crossover junction endodeoxyribonuclease RuvC